jgi:hypothetical protein
MLVIKSHQHAIWELIIHLSQKVPRLLWQPWQDMESLAKANCNVVEPLAGFCIHHHPHAMSAKGFLQGMP